MNSDSNMSALAFVYSDILVSNSNTILRIECSILENELDWFYRDYARERRRLIIYYVVLETIL